MYFFYLLIMVDTVISRSPLNKDFVLVNDSEPEIEIANILMSNGYLPNDEDLPKSNVQKKTHNQESYILSKLSDDDLIKLLSEQSEKNTYSLNDLLNIKGNIKQKSNENVVHGQKLEEIDNDNENSNAVFRLENREMQHQSQQNTQDYLAWQKLNNLLSVLPQQDKNKDEESTIDVKKELLFDILVAQLKSLCCKKKLKKQKLLSSISKDNGPSAKVPFQKSPSQKSGEFIFLITNDEIKTETSDELILVDPDTLEKNSSVLLLGPITTPLTDEQLKTVMSRLTSELSKPEYRTLLQQLSNGTLSVNNKSLMEKFVFGPDTRRYIKPHRCNYQSKLARVYGGPRWLICTGYINLNKPSLYD